MKLRKLPESHPFDEADQCARVPVRVVPISDQHPAGLAWERPCRCPKWASLRQQIIRTVEDGAVVKESIEVGGCLFRLLPWMLGTGIEKANQGLAELGACRKEVDQARQGLLRLAALALGGGPVLLTTGTLESALPAAAALPAADNPGSENGLTTTNHGAK